MFRAQVQAEAFAPKVGGDDDQNSSMAAGPTCEALFVSSLATCWMAFAPLPERIRTTPFRLQNLLMHFRGVCMCLWTSGMIKTWLFDNELFQGEIE